MPDERNPEWWKFVQLADQFIVAYVTPSPSIEVALFNVGHAAELYLKALLLRSGRSVREVVKHGHDIASLLGECADACPELTTEYVLRKGVLEGLSESRGVEAALSLSHEDEKHYREHQELYLIAYTQGQMRYFGAAMGHELIVAGAMIPSTYWMDFFRNLRKHMKYPPKGVTDVVATHVNQGDLAEPARDYLQYLLDETAWPTGGFKTTLSVAFPMPRDPGRLHDGAGEQAQS